MTTVLAIILTIVVLIFGFWLIQYSGFRNEEKKRQWELKRESQKTISPIRLRAYERLALLLERTKPEHMILELQKAEPDALNTWTVGQVQQYLLQTIRAEFDHNQSQQVYVSDEVWDLTPDVYVMVLVTTPSATVVTLPVAIISVTSPSTNPSPPTVTAGLVKGVPSYGLSSDSLVSVTLRFLIVNVPFTTVIA